MSSEDQDEQLWGDTRILCKAEFPVHAILSLSLVRESCFQMMAVVDADI